jgi:DNA polymerase
MTISIDFETRSAIDLTEVGAHRYAQHPSTSVLCASYSIDEGPIMQWRPWQNMAMPIALTKAIYSDENIHAWNASFERLIFKHTLKIDLPPTRYRCTMARARSMALPGKLEMCGRALHAPVQKLGNKIMLKWCKPLKNGGWADDPEEYNQLCNYCDVDVATEMGIGSLIRVLTDEEQRDWELNERINDNGLPIDLELVRAAQHYAADELDEIRDRISFITQGQVTSPRQFARIKDWLGMDIDSLDASARAALLEDDEIQGNVRELLQLVDDGGRASTAKFATMEARANEMDRVQGAYIFSGAGQTGRFSSSGAQLHNFVRAKLDNPEDVIDLILARAPKKQLVAASKHNVLTTLSRILRPSIVAANGHTLVWGDWKAIEARVLPWLSRQDSATALLQIFRNGEDIYKYQASTMFGAPVSEVTEAQRQAGKVAILSLGFGGGKGAFKSMAKNYDMIVEDELAEMYKRTWRQANPWAPRFWSELEAAFFNAVRNPGEIFPAGRVAYLCAQSVLWCQLPSGRLLSYPFPRVETIATKFGPQDAVTCIKGSWAPKRGVERWPRMKLWGGLAAENITQGEAASLLRWALREMADSDWLDCMIGHTHDELLLEVPDAEVDSAKAALRDVMTNGPTWAEGLPLAADIESGAVYGK